LTGWHQLGFQFGGKGQIILAQKNAKGTKDQRDDARWAFVISLRAPKSRVRVGTADDAFVSSEPISTMMMRRKVISRILARAYRRLTALNQSRLSGKSYPEQQKAGLASPEVKLRSLLTQSRL